MNFLSASLCNSKKQATQDLPPRALELVALYEQTFYNNTKNSTKANDPGVNNCKSTRLILFIVKFGKDQVFIGHDY